MLLDECVKDTVKVCIEKKIESFELAVQCSNTLSIDGILYKGEMYEGVEIERDCFKVMNSKTESAVLVAVDAVIEQELKDIIGALETGITHKLIGVTRIVGYYSAIKNWNVSKVQELRQRAESRANSVGYSVEGPYKSGSESDALKYIDHLNR